MILITSLNFNPGHYSHLIANYKLIKDLGEDAALFIHPKFKIMDEDEVYKKITSLSELKNDRIKATVFWFPSLKNIKEIIKLKVKYRSKIVYVLHEPFDSLINYRNGGFSWFKIGKVFLINIINVLTIILSDSVILPSDKAYNLYKNNLKRFNRNFSMIPLMFDDEMQEMHSTIQKKYISYVGTVAEDHAFNTFLDFFNFVQQNDLLPDYTFKIATKSVIPFDVLQALRASKNIVIQEGKPLTNGEINEVYASSFIVWNAYNRTMQSGVLPKALMFGTPVIITKNNATSYLKDNVNAVIVDRNTDFLEITKKIELLKFTSTFLSSRKTFLSHFYYKNYLQNFKKNIYGTF